jgi:hypothetical protein
MSYVMTALLCAAPESFRSSLPPRSFALRKQKPRFDDEFFEEQYRDDDEVDKPEFGDRWSHGTFLTSGTWPSAIP